MKIRDYVTTDGEKEAKLRAIATFSSDKSVGKDGRSGTVPPFGQAVMDAISYGAKGTVKGMVRFPVATWVCISQTCEHSCSGCCFGGDSRAKGVFMDARDFPRLIRGLCSLKTTFIHLFGGEPTLHPEFHTFVQMCAREGLNLSLLTNATWLDPVTVKLIVEDFSFLRVSLDASNGQVYNRIHRPQRPGEFEKVLENVEVVVAQREERKSKLVVGAQVRLCQANMNLLEEITSLVKDLGLDYVKFQVNRNASECLLPDQEQQVSRLIDELTASFSPFPVYGEIGAKTVPRGCLLSPFLLVVGASGDVYSCSHFARGPENSSFGNIFTQSARNIWDGEAHTRVVKQLKEQDCGIRDCRWSFYSAFLRLTGTK